LVEEKNFLPSKKEEVEKKLFFLTLLFYVHLIISIQQKLKKKHNTGV